MKLNHRLAVASAVGVILGIALSFAPIAIPNFDLNSTSNEAIVASSDANSSGAIFHYDQTFNWPAVVPYNFFTFGVGISKTASIDTFTNTMQSTTTLDSFALKNGRGNVRTSVYLTSINNKALLTFNLWAHPEHLCKPISCSASSCDIPPCPWATQRVALADILRLSPHVNLTIGPKDHLIVSTNPGSNLPIQFLIKRGKSKPKIIAHLNAPPEFSTLVVSKNLRFEKTSSPGFTPISNGSLVTKKAFARKTEVNSGDIKTRADIPDPGFPPPPKLKAPGGNGPACGCVNLVGSTNIFYQSMGNFARGTFNGQGLESSLMDEVGDEQVDGGQINVPKENRSVSGINGPPDIFSHWHLFNFNDWDIMKWDLDPPDKLANDFATHLTEVSKNGCPSVAIAQSSGTFTLLDLVYKWSTQKQPWKGGPDSPLCAVVLYDPPLLDLEGLSKNDPHLASILGDLMSGFQLTPENSIIWRAPDGLPHGIGEKLRGAASHFLGITAAGIPVLWNPDGEEDKAKLEELKKAVEDAVKRCKRPCDSPTPTPSTTPTIPATEVSSPTPIATGSPTITPTPVMPPIYACDCTDPANSNLPECACASPQAFNKICNCIAAKDTGPIPNGNCITSNPWAGCLCDRTPVDISSVASCMANAQMQAGTSQIDPQALISDYNTGMSNSGSGGGSCMPYC